MKFIFKAKEAWENWDPVPFADLMANVGPWILIVIFLGFVASAL